MPQLYASIDGITKPLQISVVGSHQNATAMATITAESTTLDIGDSLSIDLGFTDNHAEIFNGFIKTVERNTPDNSYILTAQDKLVQAIDYFIVSQSPNEPYNYGKGISAEDLVSNVLALADLTVDHIHSTNFEFGVNNDVEVNLVSSYDYAKMIADIVTWNLWCDKNGEIYFQNRKPFVMGADAHGQIHWNEDSPINAIAFDDLDLTTFSIKRSEKDLRNRIVVYGEGGIKADVSSETSYDPADPETPTQFLPDGFYKSVVVSYGFIGTQAIANSIANYNLTLLNKITETCSLSFLGKPELEARQVIKLVEPITGLVESNWYIYTCEHIWGNNGYVTSLELRR
jgi:hypothetical protein